MRKRAEEMGAQMCQSKLYVSSESIIKAVGGAIRSEDLLVSVGGKPTISYHHSLHNILETDKYLSSLFLLNIFAIGVFYDRIADGYSVFS